MKCMHCLVEFHDKVQMTYLGKDTDGYWVISQHVCPACMRMNLFLVNGEPCFYEGGALAGMLSIASSIAIRPKGHNRPPCPSEVPTHLAEDYREACLVLQDSPKASAALSRRCVQNLLREAAKVKAGDLSNEIQQVIDSKQLPSNLADAIDAIRNTGNFAAHPIKSKSTGEIVAVEPHEAEWNLDVLEELFDHYYVKPARLASKRAALNSKLQDAGKPPMK